MDATNGANLRIEDLRHHSPDTVETLRALLASGANIEADPKRPHFYELAGETHVFYLYISPVDGGVTLLATWPRYQLAEAAAQVLHLNA